MSSHQIELRGVRVNNLNHIDLDIPHGQFVAICGVSGSGKSSFAFETLFAEGQRRYFESLSTYTRQFLEQLDKPDADRIDNIPPAIALRANRHFAASGIDRHRTTVADATEITAYLGSLYSKIGVVRCPRCQILVQKHDPTTVLNFLKSLDAGTKYQIAFDLAGPQSNDEWDSQLELLRMKGFRRVVVNGQTNSVDDPQLAQETTESCLTVIVDRLSVSEQWQRAVDSLETAFQFGGNAISIYARAHTNSTDAAIRTIDGRDWFVTTFYQDLICSQCHRCFPDPEPALFSTTNPLGACARCNGIGSVLKLDMNLIVPDESLSIADGAIAPWNTPAYEHERHELTALADDYGIEIDKPFSQLNQSQIQLIWDGIPERKFGGLTGFFNWLEKRKYKIQIGVFLNRWKSKETCTQCQGRKLNDDGLAFEIGGKDITSFCEQEIRQAATFLSELELSSTEKKIGEKLLQSIAAKLDFLQRVGLGYLQLDRLTHSLSSGESQRTMLTKMLGSTLTSMLYVLDEPTSGLHADEVDQLLDAVRQIAERGNTVVVVDHNEQMICGVERIVEIGPGAGHEGGNIIFDGSPAEMLHSETTVTGHYVKKHSGLRPIDKQRRKPNGAIRLTGASGNNLKSIKCNFPLGCLCVVTGKSGSGKSSLVQDTLYPAISKTKGDPSKFCLPFENITGAERIDEVVLMDQTAIGRSSRSNPVTYIKAFDEIRKTFAETADAKTRNFKAGHFSFNVDGGRCEKCKGAGQLTIDMQFMSDIHVRCAACSGKRFRDAVLDVKYRSKNIDDCLAMSAQEAFVFFRGKTKVQAKLKALIDVGLGYIRLGQPATTLSAGEAQRLKLAHHLNAPKTQRALFIMDEPTFGLHTRDVIKLVECFDSLIAAGHSIIATEHNLHLLKHADWVIDMGPGAAAQGGEIVAEGTPEEVSQQHDSVTGQYLKTLFTAEAESLQAVE